MKTEIGYYTVNEKQFSSKLEAVLEAQKTNADVCWNFFDDKFKKANWEIEPELSLDQLYKARAEQIRNSYDYVIIFCSGGADSTNIVKTFINNNIKIDEVVGIAPMEGIKNWSFDKNNYSSLNAISETKFALLPLLDELAVKHGIKTTLLDYFANMINYKDDDWVFNGCGNIVTTLTSHFTSVVNLDHVNKIIERGKKVALVYGTDKPIIKEKPNGEMVYVFGDGAINYLAMPEDRHFPNVDRVLFYYTADLPEIAIKQAHVVARAVNLPEFRDIYENEVKSSQQTAMLSFLNFQDAKTNSASKDKIFDFYKNRRYMYELKDRIDYRSLYQRAIVPYIYPTTHVKNLWQAEKINITESFFTRDQDWIHILHKGTRLSEMIISGSQYLYNSISPKYLNYKGAGFFPCSKMYTFGRSFQFKNNSLNK